MTHAEAFGDFETTRQLVACGVQAEVVQFTLNRMRPDVCLEREAGIQEQRGRVPAILYRSGTADDPAETLRMIEAG